VNRGIFIAVVAAFSSDVGGVCSRARQRQAVCALFRFVPNKKKATLHRRRIAFYIIEFEFRNQRC
jgi:hypothetical protein